MWNSTKLIGVVHLPPLPGSPGWNGQGLEHIVDRAKSDHARLLEAGFEGIIVENFGDAPFFKDDVPAIVLTAMTRILTELDTERVPVGVNVLRNDAKGALAIAGSTGAKFIRVNVHTGAMLTDQGIIEGRAAETVRTRRDWAPSVQILADVAVKHAQPMAPIDLIQSAKDTLFRGHADGIIVTGSGTGEDASLDDVRLIKDHIPKAFVLVGSGVHQGNVNNVLKVADGVIVGSSLKVDGIVQNPVDPARARSFIEAARG